MKSKKSSKIGLGFTCSIKDTNCRFLWPKTSVCDYVHECKHKKAIEKKGAIIKK